MSVPSGESAHEEWAPIVYGRTRDADNWWQAVPKGVDHTGWLRAQVAAVVAGGVDVDRGPRFLLAQNRRLRLCGVACEAARLSESMHSDGDRELYCFVGWLAPRVSVRAAPPRFGDLMERYKGWAGPVYREFLEPVWTQPSYEVHQPQPTRVRRQLWAAPEPDVWPEPLPWGREAYGPWPPDAWDYLWSALAQSSMDFTCVVGWEQSATARAEGVSHLGTYDAPRRRVSAAVGRMAAPAVPEVRPLESPSPAPVPEPYYPAPGGQRPPDPSQRRQGSQPPGWPLFGVSLAAMLATGFLVGHATASGATAQDGVGVTMTETLPATPEPVQPVPAGGPIRITDLVVYQNGALVSGPAATALVPLPNKPGKLSAQVCADALRMTPSQSSIKPVPDGSVCVGVGKDPGRNALVQVTAVNPESVVVEVTVWS